jgi:hypothetical protein
VADDPNVLGITGAVLAAGWNPGEEAPGVRLPRERSRGCIDALVEPEKRAPALDEPFRPVADRTLLRLATAGSSVATAGAAEAAERSGEGSVGHFVVYLPDERGGKPGGNLRERW